MLVAERQRKIVELVNERQSIRVTELSQIFSVTEETIRRDLEKLEKENLLHRSHGGAVSIDKDQTEVSYLEREVLHSKEKRAIALEATRLIDRGDLIILDASTTAWYMAKEIPDMPLTVITNSIKVCIELSKKEQVKVICTGGMLLSQSLSYVGHLAERSLQHYHVNKAFISCKGAHLQGGLSESNEWQALLKKQMMNIAEQTILMVDSSKFATQTFVHVAHMEDVDQVITDSHISEDYQLSLRDHNISLKVVAL
ncbi:DeoR/GlpR family transcriptional regulator of sugar metabolism [Pullulanibacillus pueri]|uniref:Putative HTH-type transcriptional regulator YulB n=1 Tax=Pullulanibacillus pueri TaxID=1437324 RepID=A0A8J2ZTB1_9BACL|nr:DeoR/GlpR family DNA-binding transcription regulator [Pullulanibacillus pueri]MBM7681162.1 DeoR/GlpR family transcriptional regulator of sugar metabolism [Pullulanibacillus pueri]GGH77289.1 putative HTH-type transcriptional regulator YulB [Pullulanibacillus pueri]